jgi:hypothetical protein
MHHAPGVVLVAWVAEADDADGFVVLKRATEDAAEATSLGGHVWSEVGRAAADARSFVVDADAGDAVYGVAAVDAEGRRSTVTTAASSRAPSAATFDPPDARPAEDIEVKVLDLRGAPVPFAEVHAVVRAQADGPYRKVWTITDPAGVAGLNHPQVWPRLAHGTYDVFLIVAYPHGAPAAAVLRRVGVELPGQIVVDPRDPSFVDLTLWVPQAEPSNVGSWGMLEWAVPPADDAVLIGETPIDAGTLLRVEPGVYVAVATLTHRDGGSARLWAPLEVARGGSVVLGHDVVPDGALEVAYVPGPGGRRPDRVDVVVTETFGDPAYRAGHAFGEGVLRLSVGAWSLRATATVSREDGTWWLELPERVQVVGDESAPVGVRFGGALTLAFDALDARADPPLVAARAVARDAFSNQVRVLHWSPMVDHRAVLMPLVARYRIVSPDGGEAGAGEATVAWRRDGMALHVEVPLPGVRAAGVYRLDLEVDTGPFAGWARSSGTFTWP